MKRLDEAKLLLFSDRVLMETPFTSAPSILTLALPDVHAGGGTALNDALYLALDAPASRGSGARWRCCSPTASTSRACSRCAGAEKRAQERRHPLLAAAGRRQDAGRGYRVLHAWRDVEAHEREQRC